MSGWSGSLAGADAAAGTTTLIGPLDSSRGPLTILRSPDTRREERATLARSLADASLADWPLPPTGSARDCASKDRPDRECEVLLLREGICVDAGWTVV